MPSYPSWMDWLSHFSDNPTILALLKPERLYAADEARSAPRRPGIYGWYFDTIPAGIDASSCHSQSGWYLLYCGISPNRPPTNGRSPSKAHIRQRIGTHLGGNASGSTLRLTLGCLLEGEIGTALRRVGSSGRFTFTNPGEQVLDRWLQSHARVCWAEHPSPWEPEHEMLQSGIPLPLNIDGNPCGAFKSTLSAVRAAARRRAEAQPLILDNGGPRRAHLRGLQV